MEGIVKSLRPSSLEPNEYILPHQQKWEELLSDKNEGKTESKLESLTKYKTNYLSRTSSHSNCSIKPKGKVERPSKEVKPTNTH